MSHEKIDRWKSEAPSAILLQCDLASGKNGSGIGTSEPKLQLNVALVQKFVGVNCIWYSGFVQELGVVELHTCSS